jgi:dethiobiotin synthetase
MDHPRDGTGVVNPSHSSVKSPVIFITGTDTSVGKTVMTGLLLQWLRSHAQVDAVAIKPFISGDLLDARLLASIQGSRIPLDTVAPYRYQLPLAPGVAAESEGGFVRLRTAVAFIERMRGLCRCLLVEGCGGLLSPLGRGYTALDIIDRLGAHVIVVAPNRLGAINQVLLTVRALESIRVTSLRVVLMNREAVGDCAASTNQSALKKRLKCSVTVLPYLGRNTNETRVFEIKAKFLQKTLAGLLPSDTVTAFLEVAVVRAAEKKRKERLDR